MSIAGCTAPDVSASPAGSPSVRVTPSLSPSASSTPTPDPAPTLHPRGTAEDNLPLFTAVVDQVWASPDRVSGRAYVDALVAAGFDKSAMQVTRDQTTVGNPAESIQFSVRWGDQCLLGQVGPATGEAVTIVAPSLDEGLCLVGETRPIDW
jgi:Domain of unknown function (DUF6993)